MPNSEAVISEHLSGV